MEELNRKINDIFPGLVVRKDLVKTVKGNAPVPGYVLEYLLGQYCASDDSATIEAGIEQVKEILRVHYVNRNEAELVKSRIKERGHHKIIDSVSVELNAKGGFYEMAFQNLGIRKVPVDTQTVKDNRKLLVGGVWSLIDVQYDVVEEKDRSPWTVRSLKPIQMSSFDRDAYIEARNRMTTVDWIDTLLQTIGFAPDMLSERKKLFQLLRLVPFCERNYNLMELGPKGTGKSHIYSQCSPHGMLLSGGEATLAKLFVNNSSAKIGLVGFWDCIAFDEFAGRDKKVDKKLVDVMKNYMANHSFSRGVATMDAEASFAFVGNTAHAVPYMLKNSTLFDTLPAGYHDSAFLDRIHSYLPGWEVDITRGELFTNGYGLIVDYLSEALHSMREWDFSNAFEKYFCLSSNLSERDKEGVRKTFSGLMKVIHPDGTASKDEMRTLLSFAIEGRKRVKDQLMRIDATYDPVEFHFEDVESNERMEVKVPEEIQHPELYWPGTQSRKESLPETIERPQAEQDVAETHSTERESASATALGFETVASPKAEVVVKSADESEEGVSSEELQEGVVNIAENQKGVDFAGLFAEYLNGAKQILVVDPYIRKFPQVKNMMELCEVILAMKAPEDEVSVKLQTVSDEYDPVKQDQMLQQVQGELSAQGIDFQYEYKQGLHDRWIDTDTGWRIMLTRGLDIYQSYDYANQFSLEHRMAKARTCKAFSVTYVKQTPANG